MKLKYLIKESPCGWQLHCYFCLPWYNPTWYCLFINQSINQSIIILIGIVYQPFNQSFNQFIHPSIHQIDCLFHTEKQIAFLWLNNNVVTSWCNTKIHINLYPKVGNDDQTNTRTCGIKITCIIWLFHLRSSLFISWVFLHRKLCWIPPC